MAHTDSTPSDFNRTHIVSRTCSVEGCERSRKARGYCHKHYARWRRNGEPVTLHPHSRSKAIPSRAEVQAEMLAALDQLSQEVVR